MRNLAKAAVWYVYLLSFHIILPSLILTSQPPPLFCARGPRLNPKSASARKLGAANTPFSAATIESVYSQDSWDEEPNPDTGKCADGNADADACAGEVKRSANHFRVDRRRFGVAFSPTAKFILPLASASATKSTFVLNLPSLVTAETEKPLPQCSSPSLEEHIPHAVLDVISEAPNEPVGSPPAQRNDEVIVAVALQLPEPPTTPKAPRSAKSSKFTFDRTSFPSMSLRSPAQGLSRFFSRVSLPARRTSRGDKRQKAKQDPPPPKRRTAHPVPPVPSLLIDEESIIVFDLKNCEVDEEQQEASDDRTTHEAMIGSHNNGLLPPPLPVIAFSPLEVQFDGSMVRVL